MNDSKVPSKFDHLDIEKKIFDQWEKKDIYRTPELFEGEEKYYSLYSFPYPSGSGLHVGHAEGMVANDIMARFARMKGKKVTLPMGWDSFGLPAENYAIKTGVLPQENTDQAIEVFIEQIKRLGISVDWEKEVGAHRPDYYKWTQWFFSKLYEAGLAYKDKSTVNWCPSCMTVLANEQVIEGVCERCDTQVDHKEMDQWFFRITDYADRLIDGLTDVDWPNPTKQTQINWIGKSEGINIKCKIKDFDYEFDVYDSVPQTYTAQTFAVIAAEHPKLLDMVKEKPQEKAVIECIARIKKSKETDRFAHEKNIDGVFTGCYVEDPYGTGDLPLWIASFAIVDYGSGIVNCSAHDERDFDFAKKFDIPLRPVMFPSDKVEAEKVRNLEYCYHHADDGVLESPPGFEGRKWREVREDIIDHLENIEMGRRAVNYKLRDWLISRQRYWGAPIPAIWKERQDPDKVAIIHGIFGSSEENWFPWLKSKIKNQKSKVKLILENMPNPDKPELDAWLEKISKMKLTENSSIVAHSLGGFVALKYAESNKLKQLVLVAPTGIGTDEYWREQDESYPDFPSKWVRKNMYVSGLDVESIVDNVEEIVMIFGKDDPYVTGDIRDQYKEQFGKYDNVEIRTFLNNGYFGSGDNCENIPQLLEYFKDRQYKVLFEKDLPLLLPTDVDFIPEGYSPLSRSEEYSKRIKEKFGQEWTPEFDTMDTFVCSSWYYFRFLDPKNSDKLAASDEMNKWMPVDLYMIGAEHTVLHLMYSRFFTKFLHDLGMIDFDEPFEFMRHMGIIRGPDDRKMSKRWGNVINPTDVADKYGADTLRMYEMFMGPIDQGKAWSETSVQGIRRFLDRVYKYSTQEYSQNSNKEVDVLLSTLIKRVGEDTEQLKFNTSISEFMKFLNSVESLQISKEQWAIFIQVLAPYAPFLSDYMWLEHLGHSESVHLSEWPIYDKAVLESKEIIMGVQVNGKRRGEISVGLKTTEEEAIQKSKEQEKLDKYIQDGYKKVIYVPGRILNFIV